MRNRLPLVLLLMITAHAARGAAPSPPVTDERIVAAMKAGADFLLKSKKGDNWESGTDWTAGGQKGGETALVLYALLHAGESLADDPVYGPKLHWRSPELAGPLAWLSAFDAEETYAVGLQASALSLIPRKADAKPGEGPQAALQRDFRYLVAAMGTSGGYSYGPPGMTKARGGFSDVWLVYYKARQENKDPKAIADARKNLDNMVRSLDRSFGGAEFEIKRRAEDLRELLKAGGSAGAAASAELTELNRYSTQMPQATPHDFAGAVARAKKDLDDAVRRAKTRNTSGLKDVKVEDLPARVEAAKKSLERAQLEQASQFDPLGDISNAQYGALGMWALAEAGFEVPTEYWKVTDRFWRMTQKADGSWPYNTDKFDTVKGSPAMAVAGVATLFLTRDYLDRSLPSAPRADKNIDMGLAWLNANFKPTGTDLYYMYGVERVGLATGMKFWGQYDWFREGAQEILKHQKPDGSWEKGHTGTATPATSTAFALLFLSRGRNPVLFNKLQYDGPWNTRPSDYSNVTRWMSRRFERPMNWQVVNLNTDPAQWHDAPILLITGSQDPHFTGEDLGKLKAFVDGGGIIFSTADENGGKFTEAVRKAAQQMVANRFEMRQLPKSHLLFSRDLGADLPNPPTLLGLSNGVRELWVHSPTDMGAAWQTKRYTQKDCFELPSALFFYATGKAPLASGYAAMDAVNAIPKNARSLTLARVIYNANADPEPGAWPRLVGLLRPRGINLKLANIPWSELDPKKYPLAHVTGTDRFSLTPDESATLQHYLDGGGLLLADSAGGNAGFTDSFLRSINALYPSAGFTPLPADHPILTGKFNKGAGPDVSEITFRRYGIVALGKGVSTPSLDVLMLNGKPRVIFSQWDITSGLLGTNTWGITGYAPASAQQIAENLLRWSLETH